MLALLNHHPRDDYITFEESGHKYTVKSDTNYTSVTTFIKSFFNKFDADKILNKMIRFGSFAKKYGSKTPQEVKDEWIQIGQEASERGTLLHKYIEDFYNGIDAQRPPELAKEIGMFYNFFSSTRSLEPYRTEWYIWDEEHRIAGSIDMLFRIDPVNAPNKVAIYDWKCSKEIKTSNKYEKALPPISHLDDCNKNHYTLQLNLYKYILEKNYGLIICGLYLVVIHKTHDNFEIIPVPDMIDNIKQMLAVGNTN